MIFVGHTLALRLESALATRMTRVESVTVDAGEYEQCCQQKFRLGAASEATSSPILSLTIGFYGDNPRRPPKI